MRPRLLFAACLLAVALAAVLVLVQDAPRRSGTNNVDPGGEVVRLAPGREVCQAEDLPPATRVVELSAQAGAVSGPPAVAAVVRAPDGSRVRGRTRPSAPAGPAASPGPVRIELTRTPAPGPSQLCVANRGSAPLSLLGVASADPADAPRLLRRSRPIGTVAVDYYRGGSETWLALAPTVADRFGLGKSGLLGGWALWLVAAMVLGAWVCAALAIARREPAP